MSSNLINYLEKSKEGTRSKEKGIEAKVRFNSTCRDQINLRGGMQAEST